MALFSWSDDLELGNPMIDADHKKLIAMVNAFHDAMALGKGHEAIGRVLDNLVTYTKEHFKREEAEMQRIKYAKSIAHKLEHDKLIKDVAELQNSFSSGKTLMTITVSKFLRDWLLTHIKQTDKQLAAALK